jgi:hypothetical protein
MVGAMAHDESVHDPDSPLSDLAYDWITVVKAKAEALLAYDKYIEDAEAANSKECVEMFRRLYQQDTQALEEAKRHLTQVLSGDMGQSGQQQRRGMSGTQGGMSSGGGRPSAQSGGGSGGAMSGSQSTGSQSGVGMTNAQSGDGVASSQSGMGGMLSSQGGSGSR